MARLFLKGGLRADLLTSVYTTCQSYQFRRQHRVDRQQAAGERAALPVRQEVLASIGSTGPGDCGRATNGTFELLHLVDVQLCLACLGPKLIDN